MFSLDSWVIIGSLVLLGLLYEWARSRLVELFAHVFNFAKHQCIGTVYDKFDRNSANEQSLALVDATKTVKDDSLDLNEFENEADNFVDRSSCGLHHLDNDPSMDMPCSFSKSTKSETTDGDDSDANVELAVSSTRIKPDQSSDAFETAINAALEEKLGGLETSLEARLQTYLTARLDNLGGVYVTPAVLGEKLSELEGVVGR
jgi:hypothetical protein